MKLGFANLCCTGDVVEHYHRLFAAVPQAATSEAAYHDSHVEATCIDRASVQSIRTCKNRVLGWLNSKIA